MGSSEMDNSVKEAKDTTKESKTANSQEQASATAKGTVNPDWTGFQPYPHMPPPGFMASSPQAHPYMWGVQRRKQSNRESARRSRLRKQAECDELAQRAEILREENTSLRAQVGRLRSDYDQLLAQNASLKERLGEVPGREETSGANEQETGKEDHQGEQI
ncbi:hypothetical protein M8C21_009326 [Ambrosia artemisiifolia]|uniref:BZIP domain-containing protein n=1 Tax=Ambrosia artemisiifolia TaxID=4212 RepID=A0AAD5CJX1_AMBAR|nr:hypothetical protein M8C21_009326 [Ambrosia artemisiifolia]